MPNRISIEGERIAALFPAIDISGGKLYDVVAVTVSESPSARGMRMTFNVRHCDSQGRPVVGMAVRNFNSLPAALRQARAQQGWG